MKLRTDSKNKLSNGVTKIHNVRFYNLAPRSIQCLAYNKIFLKLALSRCDGSIEIWDMQHAPCLERTIPKSPGNSVEGLAWSGERLFSVGTDGELVEWDLQLMQPRRLQHATGNSIWCLDVNALGTELAVGTEEGYINIFDIDVDQMQYKLLFDKQEGRVLCCKFDQSGEFLVTGSMNAIRIWDVRKGHALHKMSVGRAEKKSDVIVWSLQVLSDLTIISGDSRGQINVWDGRNGSMIESHQVLKADILAVAVNEEEDILICSGIEPIIRLYAKTQIKKEDMIFDRWIKYLQRSVHDHDVKALICTTGNHILSGGADGYLGISSALKARKPIAKYVPTLQKPCVTIAPTKRLILQRYTNYLEIWRLGSTTGIPLLGTAQDDEGEKIPKSKQRQLLAIENGPEKILEFRSKNDEPIVCATLSPNGEWLCYSTLHEIRIFRFATGVKGESTAQLSRIKYLPEQFSVATHLLFDNDSKRLFVVNAHTRQINIFALISAVDGDLDFVEGIETGKHIKDIITILTISQCGLYLVAAGADRTIAIWRVDDGKHFKHHLNLPRYSAPTTALALHVQQPRLVATFSDGKIFEYDFEELCFTCSSQEAFVDNFDTHCTINIVLDPRNPNIILLQNDSYMYTLEKCSASSDNKNDKTSKKLKAANADSQVPGLILKTLKKYEHLIHLAWLSPDELVAVSVNPISLIEQLPGAFKQKKFGSS